MVENDQYRRDEYQCWKNTSEESRITKYKEKDKQLEAIRSTTYKK